MEKANKLFLKLIILQGIPGSGKSTLAKKLLKQYGSDRAMIVNRDTLRSMCGDYCIPTREDLITSIEFFAIEEGLRRGFHVIVDATNLNPRVLRKLNTFGSKYGAQIIFMTIKMHYVRAYLQVLWRKLLGGRYISISTIKHFYDRYKEIIGV